MRRKGAVFIAILLLLPVAPAGAEVTQQQLKDAKARVTEKSAELEDELAELDAVLAQQAEYEIRIANIESEMSNRERQITISAFAAREQARAMYVSAGSTSVQAAVSPEGITRLGTKNAYLDAVVDQDVDAVNELEFLQADFAALQVELETLRADQEDLAARISVVTSDLMRELDGVNQEYQALLSQWQKEEAERQRRAAAARLAQQQAAAAAAAAANSYASSAFVDPSGRTCPVVGAHSFRDSWLEPRPYRNGYHHGTDLVASEGTPLVAMEAGVIIQMGYHWAGGNGMYIRGNSGDVYYYAHMQKYAPGVGTGTRVGVAQLVGYVGNTGASSMPHLHLGYQPGGGALTNPYQLLVKLCR